MAIIYNRERKSAFIVYIYYGYGLYGYINKGLFCVNVNIYIVGTYRYITTTRDNNYVTI